MIIVIFNFLRWTKKKKTYFYTMFNIYVKITYGAARPELPNTV